jgi:uncharacterized repeat protein (TIGR01451 family)
MNRRKALIGVSLAWVALGAIAHGRAGRPGQSFIDLSRGYSQQLFGVVSDFSTAGGYLGGIVVLQNGDVIAAECLSTGSRLHRFHADETFPGSTLHVETDMASAAGCGIVLHPDGTLYSNMDGGAGGAGVVNIDPTTGETIRVLGLAGNALGIAVDPQTGHVVYAGRDCRAGIYGATCTLYDLDTVTGETNTLEEFKSTDVGYVGGLYFDPTGDFIFLNNRYPSPTLTILRRNGNIVQQVPLAGGIDATGVAFHTTERAVVTNNTDGSMTLFKFPPLQDDSDDDDDNDSSGPGPGTSSHGDDDDDDDNSGSTADGIYSQRPTQETIASGGFRGDLMQVGPDGCAYVTQAGTRYDDYTETTENSIVQLCAADAFQPPPGINLAVAGYGVALVAMPPAIFTGQSTALTATVILQNGAPAVSTYEWDCDGDGAKDATTQSNVFACSYTTSGTKTAAVTARGGRVTGTASATVTVTLPPSFAVSLVAAPATITAGQSTTLTATVTRLNGAPAPTSYEWDCDANGVVDTTTSTNVSVCTYGTVGTKTPRVTARGGTLSGTASTPVKVTPAPAYTVTLLASPASITAGQSTTLTATVSRLNGAPAATSYEWDCDANGTIDATTTTNTNRCTYTTVGVHKPRVTARAGSLSGTATTNVAVVAAPPSADLRLLASAPASVSGGSSLTFVLTATNRGGSPASQVVLSHPLPVNAVFQSMVAPAGWKCTTQAGGGGATVTCQKASMAVGETATLSVTATVNCLATAAQILVTGAIRSSTSDPNLADNAVSLLVNATAVPLAIGPVSVDRHILWPPNHKMTDVNVSYSVSGACGAGPGTTTLSVSSNEPVEASAMKVVSQNRVRLEATRLGYGNGRIYTIVVTTTDGARTTQRTAQVLVPHDMGH